MAHSLRDLDRGEGAALHAHLFEETVDWLEPSSKCIPYSRECYGTERTDFDVQCLKYPRISKCRCVGKEVKRRRRKSNGNRQRSALCI